VVAVFLRSLRHVLYVGWQTDPEMHAFFVDGESGGRELGFSKSTHGYSNILVVVALDRIVSVNWPQLQEAVRVFMKRTFLNRLVPHSLRKPQHDLRENRYRKQ
jgi:hypothetical protein